ncbi:hypothetical protein H9L18_02240 [Vagococcus carniphilus]|uniref:Uncharacterized protein n=2 Tax=Vagococcus carniphilus TaxID=218144 RepID=A0A430B403_9ENTE|nr:hypothetical protein [Vagococcus carniphilus]QNN73439.1 hypothetical protein H9L18_02240 [Vagococcus carniphilus]RSU14932.1 hypothetical protein CBF28_07630 [Vagococcus carniphilus]
MRQLFMKRKVSNPSETFTVTNRNEKDVYGVSVNSVENSQLITIHKSENQQVAMVTKEQSNDGSTFIVEVDNKKVFIIEKGLVQGTSKYIATSDELTIDGDLFGMSFNVMLGYRKVAKVRKRWTSIGDSYEITIFEDDNEASLVGLVTTLDYIKSNEQLEIA